MKNEDKSKRSNSASWLMFMICIGFLIVMMSPQMQVPIVGVVTGLIVVLIGVIIFKKVRRDEKQMERRNK